MVDEVKTDSLATLCSIERPVWGKAVFEENQEEGRARQLADLGYDSRSSKEMVSCDLGDEEEGRLAWWEDMMKK